MERRRAQCSLGCLAAVDGGAFRADELLKVERGVLFEVIFLNLV